MGNRLLVLFLATLFIARWSLTGAAPPLQEPTRLGAAVTQARAANAPSGGGPLFLPLVRRAPVVPLPPTPTPTPVPTVHPYESRVLELTNQERAQHGCPPLAMEQRLHGAARGHSQDMASNDFFDHTGSDGSAPWDRADAAGYPWSRVAENIAAGYSSPEAVVAGWMGSAGHRANILDCALQEIGVGYVFLADDDGTVNYHHYWTQLFATPR